jgi:hypothetical protein
VLWGPGGVRGANFMPGSAAAFTGVADGGRDQSAASSMHPLICISGTRLCITLLLQRRKERFGMRNRHA